MLDELQRKTRRLLRFASGGVGSIEHVRAVAALGVAGIIVGRALYTGAVRLEDALAVAGAA